MEVKLSANKGKGEWKAGYGTSPMRNNIQLLHAKKEFSS